MTNRHALPEAIVRFAESGERPITDNRYSVTELLKPVREIVLSRRYASEIEEDVSDCLPALFGTAVHAILEGNAPEGSETEVALEAEIEGRVLSGRIDLLEGTIVSDYKTCSVSKVLRNDFADWDRQGLCYAWLVWKCRGVIVTELRFHALLKDWSKVRASKGGNYPSSAYFAHVRKLSESDIDEAERWLKTRFGAIAEAEVTLPQCTDDEKWYTGTEYAWYLHPGDPKAKAVSANRDELEVKKRKSGGIIMERRGRCLKCDLYCPCRKKCEEEGR